MEYIYIVYSPSAANLVKIGKTTRNVKERLQELSSTGALPDLKLAAIFCVLNCTKQERAIHRALNCHRLNRSTTGNKSEWFSLDLTEAISKAYEVIDFVDVIDYVKEAEDTNRRFRQQADVIRKHDHEIDTIKNSVLEDVKKLRTYNNKMDYLRSQAQDQSEIPDTTYLTICAVLVVFMVIPDIPFAILSIPILMIVVFVIWPLNHKIELKRAKLLLAKTEYNHLDTLADAHRAKISKAEQEIEKIEALKNQIDLEAQRK